MTDPKKPLDDDESKWTTGAKVGAAIGSAALVAALLYAGTRKKTPKPVAPTPVDDDESAGA